MVLDDIEICVMWCGRYPIPSRIPKTDVERKFYNTFIEFGVEGTDQILNGTHDKIVEELDKLLSDAVWFGTYDDYQHPEKKTGIKAGCSSGRRIDMIYKILDRLNEFMNDTGNALIIGSFIFAVLYFGVFSPSNGSSDTLTGWSYLNATRATFGLLFSVGLLLQKSWPLKLLGATALGVVILFIFQRFVWMWYKIENIHNLISAMSGS
ncbi:MAG: hypothetical protein WCW68_05275 [Methanothrix sp.]